jgi:hypothetical protein
MFKQTLVACLVIPAIAWNCPVKEPLREASTHLQAQLHRALTLRNVMQGSWKVANGLSGGSRAIAHSLESPRTRIILPVVNKTCDTLAASRAEYAKLRSTIHDLRQASALNKTRWNVVHHAFREASGPSLTRD